MHTPAMRGSCLRAGDARSVLPGGYEALEDEVEFVAVRGPVLLRCGPRDAVRLVLRRDEASFQAGRRFAAVAGPADPPVAGFLPVVAPLHPAPFVVRVAPPPIPFLPAPVGDGV